MNNDLGLYRSIFNKRPYLIRALSVKPENIIQAFSFKEASGSTCTDISRLSRNDGLYFGGSNITYNQSGPFGLSSIRLSGSDSGVDMVNRPGNTFGTDWNGNLYSSICWMKVDSPGVWADTSTFRYGLHIRNATDSTYYTVMGKHSTANTVVWRRRTGGVITELQKTYAPSAPNDWFCMGISHDQSQLMLNYYIWDSFSGFQILPQTISANLTDWGDHPPTQGTSLIGAGSLTLQEWIGYHSLTIVWNTMLSDVEMRKAMTP